MSDVTTIALDLAKNVFQVHGVDAEGNVVIRRQLRRSQALPFFKKLGHRLLGDHPVERLRPAPAREALLGHQSERMARRAGVERFLAALARKSFSQT